MLILVVTIDIVLRAVDMIERRMLNVDPAVDLTRQDEVEECVDNRTAKPGIASLTYMHFRLRMHSTRARVKG
jgi:hypothetical protein